MKKKKIINKLGNIREKLYYYEFYSKRDPEVSKIYLEEGNFLLHDLIDELERKEKEGVN